MNETIIGYSAVTDGNGNPLFCVDCGENANREVEALNESDMANFETAKCAVCDTTFYSSTDGHRLVEDVILLSDAANDALYKGNRYRSTEYDHVREDALDEIESIRDLADEILERERS